MSRRGFYSFATPERLKCDREERIVICGIDPGTDFATFIEIQRHDALMWTMALPPWAVTGEEPMLDGKAAREMWIREYLRR